MSFFITGTDTGVGKTHLTRILIQQLREQRIDAVGYKPVSSGERSDAAILAEASGGLELDRVNPLHFQTPVAPYVAGLLQNKHLDPRSLVLGYDALAAEHEMVIVEGVGGWECPLAPQFSVADLAVALKLPVVVVAANRLGTLNHVVLTVRAIQQLGLLCAGVILNQLEDEMDTTMITNKGVIEDLTGVPLLEHVIHGQEYLDLEQFPNMPIGVQ